VAAVEKQIKQGVRELACALKLAKGFERQKLGRRLKTAELKSNSDAIQRINAEIRAIKVLNPPCRP
jgi:hypothetical protein